MEREDDDTVVDDRAGPPVFAPGTVLADRYLLDKEVGRGAAGVVYAARDLELGELVALKVIHPGVELTDEQRDRFRREVRLARRVTHRNVARTYDIGQAEGFSFLTMELVEGMSLAEWIELEAPVDPGRATEICAQIAQGLAAAHRAGVIHRDLKPANVLVQPRGRVVITDFGVARSALGSAEQTHQGYRLVGTPAYMAPEQVEGTEISPKTDLYALGLILFELLTDTRPFEGGSALEAAVARVQREPADIRALVEVSPELAALVDELLAREPASRPPSAEAAARSLLMLAADEPRVTHLVLERSSMLDALDSPHPAFATLNPGNRSLAVLPLQFRGDPQFAYVADAVTDELIDALSMTRDLRVPARSATAPFASDRDPRQIGRALDVKAVVDGTLMWQGDRIRLAIRLIDARTAEQTWAQRFDGSAGDVFEIQDHIARRVAESLRLESQLRVTSRRISPAATVAYMQARRRALSFDGGGFGPEGALHAFERCLELEPDFPPAVAGAALIRARLLFLRDVGHPEEFGLESCRSAVTEALRVAGSMPESHIAAARLATEESDFVTAARELAVALELAPTCASAHAVLGSLQCEAGRPEEGIRRIELARELDPDSSFAWLSAAHHYALHGDLERADSLVDHAAEVDPNLATIAGYTRIRNHGYHRDFAPLRAALQTSRPSSRPNRDDPRVLFESYIGVAGPDALDRFISEIDRPESSRRRTAMMYQMAAEAMAETRHVEASLRHLERASELGLVDLDWMQHCPLLDSIRGEERFRDALDVVRERAETLWRH